MQLTPGTTAATFWYLGQFYAENSVSKDETNQLVHRRLLLWGLSFTITHPFISPLSRAL
jgi:hypothetical protein